MLSVATSTDWTQTGILGVIVLAIVGAGFKRLWVFGWTHNVIVAQLERERDAKAVECEQWKSLALSQVGITEQIVDKAAQVVYRSGAFDGRTDVRQPHE